MEAALFVDWTAGAVIDPHRGKMCKLFAVLTVPCLPLY